jgi:restriction endonuclease Mrr
MRSKIAKRILEQTPQEVKEKALKWAEEILKENQTVSEEQFKEYVMYGSLLYSLVEHGYKVWLKRIIGNENFEVKPVSVINGKIITEE